MDGPNHARPSKAEIYFFLFSASSNRVLRLPDHCWCKDRSVSPWGETEHVFQSLKMIFSQ